MDWPKLLTAFAAILAVGLSVSTFVITSKRDEKRWRRDALLDATAGFLNGSFQRYSVRAYDLKIQGLPMAKYHEESDGGRHEENLALTRLRLLASEEIVEAAEIARAADDAVDKWFRRDISE